MFDIGEMEREDAKLKQRSWRDLGQASIWKSDWLGGGMPKVLNFPELRTDGAFVATNFIIVVFKTMRFRGWSEIAGWHWFAGGWNPPENLIQRHHPRHDVPIAYNSTSFFISAVPELVQTPHIESESLPPKQKAADLPREALPTVSWICPSSCGSRMGEFAGARYVPERGTNYPSWPHCLYSGSRSGWENATMAGYHPWTWPDEVSEGREKNRRIQSTALCCGDSKYAKQRCHWGSWGRTKTRS